MVLLSKVRCQTSSARDPQPPSLEFLSRASRPLLLHASVFLHPLFLFFWRQICKIRELDNGWRAEAESSGMHSI
jgi:hypothetical protein